MGKLVVMIVLGGAAQRLQQRAGAGARCRRERGRYPDPGQRRGSGGLRHLLPARPGEEGALLTTSRLPLKNKKPLD